MNGNPEIIGILNASTAYGSRHLKSFFEELAIAPK